MLQSMTFSGEGNPENNSIVSHLQLLNIKNSAIVRIPNV